MAENKNIEVGGRLHSIATGNVLAGANEIFDDEKNKKQNDINTETYTLVNNINERLDSLSPDQQSALSVATKATNNETKLGYYVCDTEGNIVAKVISDATGYILSTGGSIKVKMTNANTTDNATLNINSTGAKPLYYDGERASANNSWEEGETVEVYYDGTSYYANNVAGGSSDGVFDVSVKYPISGIDGGNTYTLEGALAVLNANLSSNKKKGGMSIKFIQSSDNKYVQYRLTTAAWSIDISNWQNVDITKMSIDFSDWQYEGKFTLNNRSVGQTVSFGDSAPWNSFKIFVAKGNTLCMYNIRKDVSANYFYVTDLDGIIIEKIDKTGEQQTYSDYKYTATQNCYVVCSSFRIGYCIIKQFEPIEIDNTPIKGSKNPVSSDGTYNAILSSAVKLTAKELFYKTAFIRTNNKVVGDIFNSSLIEKGNGWNCDILSLCKGDIVNIYVANSGHIAPLSSNVLFTHRTAKDIHKVVRIETISVGLNTFTINDDCYMTIVLANSVDSSYIQINPTQQSVYDAREIRRRIQIPSSLFVNDEHYYNRSGSLSENATFYATDKLSIFDNFAYLLDSYIKLEVFQQGAVSLVANVVIWDENDEPRTYNVAENKIIRINPTDTYIAFSNFRDKANAIICFSDTECAILKSCDESYDDISQECDNISQEVQSQDLRLIEVENNLSDKKTYQPNVTSKFIDNFGSVVIGEAWHPTYTNNEGWNSYRIPVRKGDIVKMAPFESYGPNLTEWILFTDTNDVVVAPSEHIDNSEAAIELDELSVTALYDGYFYISLFIKKNSIVETVTSRNKIFDYIDDVRTITEPVETGKYISNFASASIGNVWTPNFGTSALWRVYKIPVRSGDYIFIDKKQQFAASIVDKVVFVDLNDVVVEPTYTFPSESGDTMLYKLSYRALTDGYMYFCTMPSNSTVVISSSLTKLYEKVDGLSLRISNVENKVKYLDDDEHIITTHYLDCPIGRQTDIFLDGIIRVEDDVKRKPYRVSGHRDIFQIGDNQLRVTPTSESSNMNLTIYKYDDTEFSKVHNSKQITFRPVSRTVGDGTTIKNICISGDSLIDGTNAPCEAFRLLNEDGDFVIHQIGTRNASMGGITYKHEGRGSWGWNTYIDTRYGVYTDPEHPTTPYEGKLNAFMIDEDLNFQKYMQKNFPNEVAAGRGIDVFIMSLGTNDVTQGSSMPSDARIAQIINDAKTFIDTLLSSEKGYPNCKVIVGLPGVGARSFREAYSFSSVFKMAILKLNKAYIDTFDNGKYHANVTCVMHGCYIDRENGYQFEDVNRNDYIGDSELAGYLSTMSSDVNVPQSVKDAVSYIANNYVSHRKTRRCLNQVHPLQIGYKQWGRGYYGKLRAVLNGLL